jgi:acylphosphatase
MTRARFIVRGLVQGVYFRAEAVRQARARGLTGCVWNRADDAVELIAEGDTASLAGLQQWLARGPRLARVDSVDRLDLADERRYTDFSIADTAPE